MRSKSSTLVTSCSNKSLAGRFDVGGKAYNLLRLRQVGFSVAPFYVITCEAFRQHISACCEEIQKLLAGINLHQPASITQVSEEIKNLIARTPISDELRQSLAQANDTHFDPSTRMVVRSSVSDEDSAASSFAGMMDSFLNVTSINLLQFVSKVWKSAYSERALAYRLRKEEALNEISVAVIVQKLVNTSVSGVMFTRLPDGDDDRMTISAGYGLGEGIVSGSIETDTFLVSRDNGRITANLSVKRNKVVINSNGSGGTRIVDVPSGLADCSTLSKDRLTELSRIGLAIEKNFEYPQDIEWGYDDFGKLYIMQTRPITSVARSRDGEPTYIWDNANIVESYPGLTLPLTSSFIVRNYEVLFRNAACGLMLRRSRLQKQSEIWCRMLGLLRGRVYYNLSSWYEMLSHLPGFRHYQRTWNQAIGISSDSKIAKTRLTPVQTLFTICRLVTLMLTVRRSARRFFRRCNRVLEPFRERDFSGADETEIVRSYRTIENDLFDFWHVTLYNDLCAFVYYDLLKRACLIWGGSCQGGLHHRLLRNSDEMESIKPLQALMKISRLIVGDESYSDLLDMSDSVAWRTAHIDSRYAEIGNALDEYIREYGDRCYDELKLESTTFRENPEALMGLIRANAEGLKITGDIEHRSGTGVSAKIDLRESIQNPLKRLVIRILASQARCAITNRENMRFARTRVYGIVRRMFRQLGQIMNGRGLLCNEEDIYYLTVDEIFGAIQGTGVTSDLQSLVALRERDYSGYEDVELPSRFTTGHYPGFGKHSVEQFMGSTDKRLDGTGCANGIASGRARILDDPRAASDCKGCVLITRTTDPSWVFLMASAAAIVSERGSVLSHTAIVGRELGIPTVVGVEGAFSRIPENAIVTVNGSSGRVSWK